MSFSTTHLLYLHGFRSSPSSFKARTLANHVRTHHPNVQWLCPQLPPSPRAAAELIERLTLAWPQEQSAVVGSSLGGYYATWLAAQRGFRLALLNPAVHPARDLARHIGQQTAWHQSELAFDFRAEYINELQALDCPGQPDANRVFALITQGDEVLDWREMTARYPGARIELLAGGDHAISDFEQHLPTLLRFLSLV